jgi:ankyrin repeat protein
MCCNSRNCSETFAPFRFGKTPLKIAIKCGLEHCVEALLTAGANPNVFWTSKYRSPLVLATCLGLDRIVALLLKFGADPNAKLPSLYPNTLRGLLRDVEYAIQLTADKPAIRSILLAAGARFVPPPPPPDSNQACRIL